VKYYENIENCSGDNKSYLISGHSAGGHLAALAAIKKEPYEELPYNHCKY
jgi:acetyl esterase/lipase